MLAHADSEDYTSNGARVYFLPENPGSNRKVRFEGPALAVSILQALKPIHHSRD
jgi:hypothetical protein